ncbi:uncharacterized protein A4U43_UnF9640 [Asparagus officinalis]|uniref:Uncharacterized protein n=1 Tax=Asparagus officinalis TaxID=4686 RepID=A0A1R3L5N1_ASPOF|nr:uncharacterized protein A4U43_UnF9640 [Asparagus officinalis]
MAPDPTTRDPKPSIVAKTQIEWLPFSFIFILIISSITFDPCKLLGPSSMACGACTLFSFPFFTRAPKELHVLNSSNAKAGTILKLPTVSGHGSDLQIPTRLICAKVSSLLNLISDVHEVVVCGYWIGPDIEESGGVMLEATVSEDFDLYLKVVSAYSSRPNVFIATQMSSPLRVLRLSMRHLWEASPVMKPINSEAHSCIVSLASLDILAFGGRTCFIILPILAIGSR